MLCLKEKRILFALAASQLTLMCVTVSIDHFYKLYFAQYEAGLGHSPVLTPTLDPKPLPEICNARMIR